MKWKSKAVCAVFALVLSAGFLLCVFWPKKDFSYSERRYLARLPGLSAEAVRSGRFQKDFEAYTVDTFPFRDVFRTVKALSAAELFGRADNNGLYAFDGFLAAMEYPADSACIRQSADCFRYVCRNYLTEENHVYLSVIPDKNCFLAQESGHLSMDYAALEEQMAAEADFAEYIPISDLLEREDYYRTDTHWRQERIADVAGRLADAMGAKLVQRYETHTFRKDFYGVYYGQAALPFAPDSLCYLTGEAIDRCSVYDWQNERRMSVYDFEKGRGRDPYELFLSGSLSLITIENQEASEERELVLFRDSFGSAVAPLLISGYSKITLADIRYIHPDLLGEFVDFDSCDVLFLYSTLTLNRGDGVFRFTKNKAKGQ